MPRAIRDDSKRTDAVAAVTAGMSRESYRKAGGVVEAALIGWRIEGGESPEG